MSGQRADSTAWPGLAPKGRTAGNIPSGLKKIWGWEPLMQCRFPMLYQGADGHAAQRRDRPEPQIRMQLRNAVLVRLR